MGLIVFNSNKEVKDNGNFKIVTSFYPIYILTLNLTEGVKNVSVENVTSEQAGCLHEYTLNTNDMRKIENAELNIKNGKGLEFFLDRMVLTYPNMKIIDSSIDIQDVENPHIWVNINNYIKQIQTVKEALIQEDPKNKSTYIENADKYINKINNEMKNFNSNKLVNAISFNESIENIIDNSKVKMTVIHTGHEETSLSANELVSILEKMKNESVKIIFVDKNERNSNAEILKKETGAEIYELDSYTKGSMDKDSYLKALRANIEVLNSIK